MKLHTIILNYRTPDLSIDAARAALVAMQGIAGGVTIVDNDSADGSAAKMRAAAQAEGWTDPARLEIVESGHNGGFGAGNNFAMARGLPGGGGRPDLVYLLNSDATPEPDAIQALMDRLARHPQAGIACSRICGTDGAPHHTAFRFPSAASEIEGASRTGVITRILGRHAVALPQPQQSLAVDWSAGASMMIRQDVLDQIGGFDETFFLYFEETDLCRRAAAAGWQTHYVVESLVTHIGSASTGMNEWDRAPDYWYDSRSHYFTKHHGRAGAWAATAAHLTGGAIWRARCLIQRRPVNEPRAHLRRLAAHTLRPSRRT